MSLAYIEFFRELLEAKELAVSQVPDFIERETGYVISSQQAYDFLDTKRDSSPTAAMVKLWERAFKINLAPKYYGVDLYFAVGKKVRK